MRATVMDVLKPGMSSTFQDLGRSGWQRFGVPVSGAMDELSHRVANLLAGNDENEPTLEMTLLGPTLRFDDDVVIALAGGDLGAEVTEAGADRAVPAPLHTPLRLRAGVTLRFRKRVSGMRCYLAIEGGFGLTPVMGSGSTYVRGGLGGLEGRALRKGDRLVLPGPQSTLASLELDEVANAALERLVAQWASVRPNTGPGRDAVHIRAMRGREWDHFTAASQAAFFSDPAVVSSQSERMGYRLSGLMLERKTQVDMLSEAVAFGSVQVPQDGQPIVLMADRQSTGGYPRVAQVASVDLPKLAQMMPGETVRFQSVGLDEAQQLLLQRAGRLAALRAALRGPDLELDAAPDDENRKRRRHEPDRSQL